MILNRNVAQKSNPERTNIIVDTTAALLTDKAIRKLPRYLRDAVVEQWIKGGTAMQKCKALNICKQTFYNRLDRAYAEIQNTLKPATRRRGILSTRGRNHHCPQA
jgi:DNA-directed RNA polymerase specialized sigma24 family protein